MALADFDQRRGRDLSRLPLFVGGQLPEFWEHSLWLDETSGQKGLDVINLHDHCDPCPMLRPDVGAQRRRVAGRWGAWFGSCIQQSTLGLRDFSSQVPSRFEPLGDHGFY